jgi:hypothetical protein
LLERHGHTCAAAVGVQALEVASFNPPQRVQAIHD